MSKRDYATKRNKASNEFCKDHNDARKSNNKKIEYYIPAIIEARLTSKEALFVINVREQAYQLTSKQAEYLMDISRGHCEEIHAEREAKKNHTRKNVA